MVNDQEWRDNPRTNPIAFDNAAEAAGITVGADGWLRDAEAMLGFMRPPGPNRKPSVRCESGKRPYCTCDTCF